MKHQTAWGWFILLLAWGVLAHAAPVRLTAAELAPLADAHGGGVKLVTPPPATVSVASGALLIYNPNPERPVLSLAIPVPADGYYRVGASMVFGPWRAGRYGLYRVQADGVPLPGGGNGDRDFFHGWYGPGTAPAYRMAEKSWGVVYLRAPSVTLDFLRDGKFPGELLGLEAVQLARVDAAALGADDRARRVPEKPEPPEIGPPCIIDDAQPLTWVTPASKTAVTVDGNLVEWNLAQPSIVINAKSIAGRGYGAPSPESDADFSMVGALAWDDATLYFAARIRDDDLANPGKEWSSFWSHDGVVMQVFAPPWLSDKPHAYLYGFNYYPPDGAPRSLPGGVRYAVVTEKGGYTIEAAIPFAVLGCAPRADDRLPYMLIPVDIDPKAPVGRIFQQYLWNTRGGDALRWGDVRLVTDKGWAATLTPEEPVYVPGTPMRYLGTIDVFRKGLSITAVEVVDTATGAVVASEPVKLPLPANLRVRVHGELLLPALPAGNYDLRVTVE